MTVTRYFIAGTKHRGPDTERLLAELPIGEPVDLIREPTNKFDRNAVQVIARGMCIGYVAANLAVRLAPLIDRRGLAMDAAQPDKRQMTAHFARTENSNVPHVLLVETSEA